LPQRTGIIGNAWWDRNAWRSVYAVEDTTHTVGAPDAPRSSPKLLNRSTLGDWLKEVSPDSKVFSVALKDRASILMAGHRADAAYWWYDAEGWFVSSSHYLSAYPEWVYDFNQSGLADEDFAEGWTRLLPAEAYHLSRDDDFEWEADGTHTTFPHTYEGSSPGVQYYTQLRSTPFGDELAFLFAEDLVRNEELGTDDIPDLLFLGGSAGDGVGHAYGPYSQEVQDYYIRIDLMLGRFFRMLDREVGKGNYLLVLTGDHGVLPLPEELKRRGIDAGRITTRPLFERIVSHARCMLGNPELKAAFSDGIYLDLAEETASDATLRTVRHALADSARLYKEIEDVFTFDELADPKTPDRPYLQKYKQTFDPDRSPDLMFRFKENYLPLARKTGTTHGSPYSYDTHVPLVFFSHRFFPAEHASQVRSIDIAPTIAILLSIPAPTDLDGAVIDAVASQIRPPLAKSELEPMGGISPILPCSRRDP
jgi:arylsulfatase A-like enzyme